MLYISPYVLEPLFNKFTPIEDEELEESIKSLLAKAGIKVSRVFKMDASRRTRHTNAYFSGIGPVKRIVLFDTLLDQLNGDEILAVLAHEAGHWKKKHIIKYLMIFEFLALTGAFLCFLLLQSDYLSRLFFISQDNFYVRLFLLGFVASIVLWPLQPLLNALSRHFERQADDFSVDLTGSASALSSALIKLSKDNLSNIHTHPLYAMFNYSHPEVIQRLRRLKSGATTVIQE
jgi:STE24 endopeptidase